MEMIRDAIARALEGPGTCSILTWIWQMCDLGISSWKVVCHGRWDQSANEQLAYPWNVQYVADLLLYLVFAAWI